MTCPASLTPSTNSDAATVAHSRSALDLVAGDARATLLAKPTTALFSPLCVASGRVPRAVTWLVAAGFEVPYVSSLRLRREHVLGLWEHLIPRLPRRRVDVVVEALTVGPSALVGLRRTPGAAGHLSDIKGVADPARRPDSSLRSYLGAPNVLTSLVHTPDSPTDLLRELQVLLPHNGALEEFWRAQRFGPPIDVDSLPPFLSGDDPPPSIDAFVIGLRLEARLLARLSRLDRMRGMLAGDAATDDRAAHRSIRLAYEQLESIASGESFDLDVLTTALEDSGVAVNAWERVVLASEWVTPSPLRRSHR